MARLTAAPVEVTEEQRATLEAIVRKRTSPQQLVMRAKIILCAAEGKGIRPTVRELGVKSRCGAMLAPTLADVIRECIGGSAPGGCPATGHAG
jgi:hypothetical protein